MLLTLYYHPICPLSRQIRVLLQECNMDFAIIKEDYWLRKKSFIEINPFEDMPIVKISGSLESVLIGYYSIVEFILGQSKNSFLMPGPIDESIRIRNTIARFNNNFYNQVSKVLINEKMIRQIMNLGAPRSDFIRKAKTNLINHFTVFTSNFTQKSYAALDVISCADIIAASHISTVDYFGEVDWNSWPLIKEWYSIIKSRPSFQGILNDRVAGFTPPLDYSNLDF